VTADPLNVPPLTVLAPVLLIAALVRTGREERGARYAVVVEADEFLGLSTTLVAPTSSSARPASFRPSIHVGRAQTQVLVEQTAVADPERLGRSAGRLATAEQLAVDDALTLIAGL
jgi:mRNA interferase MazF